MEPVSGKKCVYNVYEQKLFQNVCHARHGVPYFIVVDGGHIYPDSAGVCQSLQQHSSAPGPGILQGGAALMTLKSYKTRPGMKDKLSWLGIVLLSVILVGTVVPTPAAGLSTQSNGSLL